MNPEFERAIEIQDLILKCQDRAMMIFRCGLIYWSGQAIIQGIYSWALDSKWDAVFSVMYLVADFLYVFLLLREIRRRRVTRAIRANFVELDAAVTDRNPSRALCAADQLDACYRDL